MQKEFYVVLDGIRSLLNVGSVFRTAEALCFKKVFLCGITPSPIGGRQKREIHKTALGAEEYIEWEKFGRTWRLLNALKKEGFYIIGLELTKRAISLNKFRLPKKQKIALVIGHEKKGISSKILKKCHKIVEIPMVGRKESLNVAVAFGIAAFWLQNS
jgi:tRNA G18 (ribose-2'-O)-methylase SpoU